jgi:hypothetical protein
MESELVLLKFARESAPVALVAAHVCALWLEFVALLVQSAAPVSCQ